MHFKWILYMAAAIAAVTVFAEARRVVLRQLTADQVYTVLKAAGREDAVPEGRTVTQGIAAISGLGIGLAKGIAGSILFDVATSDATLQWLSSLLSSGTSGIGTTLISEEICFTTKGRSMESDVEAEGRQNSPSTSPSPSPTTTTGATTTSPIPTTPPTTSQMLPGTSSPTITPTPSASTSPAEYSSPTSSASPTSGASPTTTNPSVSPAPSVSPSPSPSPSPTPSGGTSGKTCIVIQKPKVRRRRSVRRKRLLAH